jgi:hypothetical protein
MKSLWKNVQKVVVDSPRPVHGIGAIQNPTKKQHAFVAFRTGF